MLSSLLKISLLLVFISYSISVLTPCPPTCSLPNCFCASKNIPGGILKESTPQFLMFSMEGPIRESQLEVIQRMNFLLNNPAIKDTLGCGPRMSVYAKQQETDFPLYNYFSKIGAVNLNSVNYDGLGLSSTYQALKDEYSTHKNNIASLGGVPQAKIQGARAPYFLTTDNYFKAIHDLNILYDTSLTYTDSATKTAYWPFTLDHQISATESYKFCWNGYCPSNPYPGLWEIPLINYDYTTQGGYDSTPNEIKTNKAGLLARYQASFMDTYNHNRAPRGLNANWYFQTNNFAFDALDIDKRDFLVEFYTWIIQNYKDNVIFATESMVIEWIKNPKTLQEIKTSNPYGWSCPDTSLIPANTCEKKKCVYADTIFEVCGSICPGVYPNVGVLWSTMTVPSNSLFGHWVGTLNINTYIDDYIVNSQCADGMKISHGNNIAAKSFILTITICKTVYSSLFKIWGGFNYQVDFVGNNVIIRIIGNLLQNLAKNILLNIGGFCIIRDLALNFAQASHLTWSLDFFDSYVDCLLGFCKTYCGNGVCDAGETQSNCPNDCAISNFNCPVIIPCTPANCQLPDCYCASKNIPGGLSKADTPQFILFTLDDSIEEKQSNAIQHLDFLLKNNNIKDALNCNLKLSFYVRQIETDFNMLNFYNKKGAIGLHTYSHTTNINTPYETWSLEENTVRNSIVSLSQIPLASIKGSRAPFLQTNDDYFKTLKDMGILYDSSMTYSDPNSKLNYWPFTLDYPLPEQSRFCYFGKCPTIPFPGVWEVPMINFDYSIQGIDMDPPNVLNDGVNYFNKYKDNFIDSYSSNRVPRGFYWHWRYLTDNGDFNYLSPTKSNFIKNWYEWLTTNYKENIIFVTEAQIIQWMKNPKTLTEIKTTNPFNWQCPDVTVTPATTCTPQVTCVYRKYFFKICGSICPSEFPSLGVNWFFPTASTIPSNALYTSWVGTLTGVTTYSASNIPNSVCMDSIKLKHFGTLNAYGFIVSINFCATVVDSVSISWASNQNQKGAYLNNDKFSIKYMNSLTLNQGIAANINYDIGGFCAIKKAGATFNPSLHMRWAVDLFDRELKCELNQCKMFCGDGVCDYGRGENETTCPNDCSITNMQCPASRRRFLEMIKKK